MTAKGGNTPFYINTSTALDMAVYKIQLKLLYNEQDQHLQTRRGDAQLTSPWGNGMQIICIAHCIILPYVRFNQGIL